MSSAPSTEWTCGAVRPSRPLRRPETAGHQLRPGTLERVPDRPPWLPSVVDAWCLLAQVATREELLAAGDWIVSGPGRYDPPAATPAALAAVRISIEYEGAHHFVGGDALRQARVDVTRVRAMEDAGWAVIRVTAHDLRHPAEMIRILTARIAQATAARNAR
ncbi:hypothetical protein [Leucobacter chromiiresistens]|uniref:DUF559 domain-containing protein n=1 Tax=Leucobacter chromiiresistens TaxID=1079994 RepID=A0A1H1BS78_9MICO|nr:hypothetical protein [Leucobacter chromiiresistens]SDQ54620.1 hypothetical protein SAMN04488565_3005 [Leucobacter chromiiresistens]